MTVEVHLFAKRFLGTEEQAAFFISTLEKFKLTPSRMGRREPVREPFDREGAKRLWTATRGTPELLAGGMMAKSDLPKYTFSVSWMKGMEARPGYLYFLIPDKDFRSHASRFTSAFADLFCGFGGLFGYITAEKASIRQEVTGTLETRLPGLFWCTALSSFYVDFFGGVDRVCSGPWHHVTRAGEEGVFLYLSESPLDKRLLDDMSLEKAGKEYLGADSFGDTELFKRDLFTPQFRRVPPLSLPEIRVDPQIQSTMPETLQAPSSDELS